MRTNPMQTVYKRLSAVGLNQKFVREVILPDWWEDRIAENPAGYAEALGLLSDSLSLDLRALQDPNGMLECRPFLVTRNKARQGLHEADLAWAQCLGGRAAQLVCSAMAIPPVAVPKSALEIRHTLGKDDHLVNFETLLDYCWSLGIPVLHVSQFPSKAKKPDGMATRFGEHYAIILSKNSRYSAWLLFILAHELAHIALGHLPENGVFVDDEKNWTTNGAEAEQTGTSPQIREDEEKQANDFAIELLTGQVDTVYRLKNRLNAEGLEEAALFFGQSYRVDPGAFVLNYVRHVPNGPYWPLANATLKRLEPDANAIAKVHTTMRANLDWELLSDENQEFLLRVTGSGKET